ncbi:nucleotide pyrophosphohydrolase [Alkalibacterium sp. 20]|uniref:nucleotide pyrophosphohydrolase n=1 Tax=Alkalibacterium sp. 20 TaxID=1798803 RepID=UPI00090029EE|nr:nucleotide pyrophosphohydrolase [Alkalibacterium sp. 20]OJF92808.1 nucleotide pyrophosphohydrolase [Alkalibacterium sp. 20]
MDEITELITLINEFRDERDWRQFHNPKDLAISISLEASELLENFQWKESNEAIQENKNDIQRELADIIIYSLMLSSDLELNIEDIVKNKLKENNLKYPVDKSRGLNKKYTDI